MVLKGGLSIVTGRCFPGEDRRQVTAVAGAGTLGVPHRYQAVLAGRGGICPLHRLDLVKNISGKFLVGIVYGQN